MIESDRLLLLPVDVPMIDSLIESNDAFYQRYGYINDAGEFLIPSLDYLLKIKNEIIDHPEYYPLAVDHLIILKESKTVIGSIDFKMMPKDGITEIGYGMSPQYEGNGYMSEAVKMMLDYGVSQGIKQVNADTLIDNVKSQNVLKRNGFSFVRKDDRLFYFSKVLLS